MHIWIDLDNSPHVPLFAPVIAELDRRGHMVTVTARDCFQVCDLARLLDVRCRCIGRHFGKNKALKVLGLATRAAQLVPTVLARKPDLAVSHGSRAQLLISALVGVPTMLIMDYEFVRGLVRPNWIMVPDVIPDEALASGRHRILKYPGIKEDIYVPAFSPDPAIRQELELGEDELIVTLRPPAAEAHYHVPESDVMFYEVVDWLGAQPAIKLVLLPRNTTQEALARKKWPGIFARKKIIVPRTVINGLNLIWHSDIVISGGGTINREAAALGVPVYSVFRGKTGAVDRYLAGSGRMALLENVHEVRERIRLVRRQRPAQGGPGQSPALKAVVEHILSAAAVGTRSAVSRAGERVARKGV
jgi:hypothetical protein